jgi:hypothetical protein
VRLADRNPVRFLTACEQDGIALESCTVNVCEWMARDKDERHCCRVPIRERKSTTMAGYSYRRRPLRGYGSSIVGPAAVDSRAKDG